MAEKTNHDIQHVEANGNFERNWREEKWGDRKLSVVAQDIAIDEKHMTIPQAIKIYKKAIMWCLVISCCVIMEGYDTNLLGNFYAYRTSQEIQQVHQWLTKNQHLSKSNMGIPCL